MSRKQCIHETTVLRHIADYLQSAKLAPGNGGSSGHFSVEQGDELKRLLTVNAQTTTGGITSHVEERYSVLGIHKRRCRNGFSYKNPQASRISLIQKNSDNLLKNMQNLSRWQEIMSPFCLWMLFTPRSQRNSAMAGYIKESERRLKPWAVVPE